MQISCYPFPCNTLASVSTVAGMRACVHASFFPSTLSGLERTFRLSGQEKKADTRRSIGCLMMVKYSHFRPMCLPGILSIDGVGVGRWVLVVALVVLVSLLSL